MIEVAVVVCIIHFPTLIKDYFSFLGYFLGSALVAEVSLNNRSLPLGFMSSSESWQFAINILRISVLIGSDVAIIDSSFMFGHEASVSLLVLSFVHLVSQFADVLLRSSLLFLLLFQVRCVALLYLLT